MSINSQYWTIADPEVMAYLNAKQAWPGLRSVGMVEAERQVGEQVTRERRYYVMSLAGNAQAFGCAVRTHWGIEIWLHWRRDATLGEDRCSVRFSPVAHMLAVLNSIVLSLMDLHQIPNVARQRRRFASHPDEALDWVLYF